jgi:hypothetical protein
MRQQALARDQGSKGDVHTALGEQLFDIAISEGETWCTEPNDVLNDH